MTIPSADGNVAGRSAPVSVLHCPHRPFLFPFENPLGFCADPEILYGFLRKAVGQTDKLDVSNTMD
ncbi:MAG: hypothetical protein ACREP2_14895 [Rhodanobacteraceae bacterium]